MTRLTDKLSLSLRWPGQELEGVAPTLITTAQTGSKYCHHHKVVVFGMFCLQFCTMADSGVHL